MRGRALIPLLLLATPAVAQEEAAPVAAKLHLVGGTVAASFDVTSAFTDSFRKRLSGGLTSRVLLEMELYDGANQSVAVAVRYCQLRLDIWDDVLFVGVTDSDRTRKRSFQLIDEGMRACGQVERAPLAPLALLDRPHGYRLMVRVALNPVSPEIVDRTREFMSNPRGLGEGRPRAFFGAVAKLFRSDSGTEGERFVFRSGPLARPAGEER